MSSFSSCLVSIIFLSLLLNTVFARRDGFSIKLIHRDSIESPLYPGNLTLEDRVDRLCRQGNARLKQLESAEAFRVLTTTSAQNQTISPYVLQPPVAFEGTFYLAAVGIGLTKLPPGPTYESYYLMVDTGSSFIWTQCQGCNPCFIQREPFFPYMRSPTYHPIECYSDPDCVHGKCLQNICNYRISYAIGAVTQGHYAKERFTFASDTGGSEIVNDFIFGCGFQQYNFNFFQEDPTHNTIAGILGVGGGDLSLVNQLNPVDTGRRFSYCLQPWMNDARAGDITTYLRFGRQAEFRSRQPQYRTRLFIINDSFRLHLLGISVQGRRLNIDPRYFAMGDASGGCVIDNGSPWTILHADVYYVVKTAVQDIFSRLGLWEVPDTKFDLCYQNAPRQIQFPTMTFHFPNADFVVNKEQLFFFYPDRFCMVVFPSRVVYMNFLMGSYMQTNRRLIYDIGRQTLAFSREDCRQGS